MGFVIYCPKSEVISFIASRINPKATKIEAIAMTKNAPLTNMCIYLVTLFSNYSSPIKRNLSLPNIRNIYFLLMSCQVTFMWTGPSISKFSKKILKCQNRRFLKNFSFSKFSKNCQNEKIAKFSEMQKISQNHSKIAKIADFLKCQCFKVFLKLSDWKYCYISRNAENFQNRKFQILAAKSAIFL